MFIQDHVRLCGGVLPVEGYEVKDGCAWFGSEFLVGRAPASDRRAPTMVGGKHRHPDWQDVRGEFLKNRLCAACGGQKDLEAHHVEAYHEKPELELVLSNLIPLCQSVTSCHYICGHGRRSWCKNTRDPWDVARRYGEFLRSLEAQLV